MDTRLKVPRRLPSGQAIPSVVVMGPQLGEVGNASDFGWLTVPVGLATLLQPCVLDRGHTLANRQRRRCLSGSEQRRDEKLIEGVCFQRRGKVLGLDKSQLRKARINNAQTVANPFGLSMAKQGEFHTRQGSGRWEDQCV